MFYQEKIIQNHLKCKACQVVFIDPRMMPCGHSFCHECILDIKGSRDGLKCPTCRSYHHMPAAGFPVNLSLAELILEEPKSINQTQKVIELRQQLKSLSDTRSCLIDKLKSSRGEIGRHFQRLREEIEIITEQRVTEIQQISAQMMRQEIDQYEAECLNNLPKPNADWNIEFELSEVLLFHSKVDNLLAKYEIEENQVIDMMEECKKRVKLLTEMDCLITASMDLNNFKFVPNDSGLNLACMGSIVNEDQVLVKSY